MSLCRRISGCANRVPGYACSEAIVEQIVDGFHEQEVHIFVAVSSLNDRHPTVCILFSDEIHFVSLRRQPVKCCILIAVMYM